MAAAPANVDVAPHGPERRAVVSGQRKMLDFEDGFYYPAQTGIDFYHHYKEDIAPLPRWALRPSA